MNVLFFSVQISFAFSQLGLFFWTPLYIKSFGSEINFVFAASVFVYYSFHIFYGILEKSDKYFIYLKDRQQH